MAQPIKLNHIDEFSAAIAAHAVSDNARAILASSPLVVLSGLAGGGRNTLINYLVQHYNYVFLVSDTTRPPKLRGGVMEKDGINYYFRNEDDMLSEIQSGEFIEAEVIHNQQVSGTSIRELKRAVASGKIPIHDFEYQGAQNVAEAKPDAHIIGLLPPSYDVWLERFLAREEIHRDEFLNRLRTAEKVLQCMLTLPYFKLAINQDVAECAAAVNAIVETAQIDQLEQDRCRVVANQLLERVSAELAAAQN